MIWHQRVQEDLTAHGLQCLAAVYEDPRTLDLAIAVGPNQSAILRCLERPDPADYFKLGSMVDQGDFNWAGVLYSGSSDSDSRHLSLPSFHLSELGDVISLLRSMKASAS